MDTPTHDTLSDERALIAQQRAEIAKLTEQLRAAESSYERLKHAYTRALEQLALARKRLYAAKAERRNVVEAQLALDGILADVKAIEAELAKTPETTPTEPVVPAASQGGGNGEAKKKRPPPPGRRNLAESDLPLIRVEIADPDLEGKAERIGVETSWRLGRERGGLRRIAVDRIVYKVEKTLKDGTTRTEILMAPMPLEAFHKTMLAPSLVAYLLAQKFLMGVPFYRLEQQLALAGADLDRTTMCRYAEDAGATLGCIVEAAREEAIASAFCLSTDATGVSIQPGPIADRGARGPCAKGHFFVVLADRDHIFFEYQPKHTSLAVCEMFKGYSGYIQADANAIYDAMFAGRSPRGAPPTTDAESTGPRAPPPKEVGCWSHCRRGFWEAAVTKHPLGVEGMRRIDAIFAADRALAPLAPAQRKVRREALVRPLVDAFFAWVEDERAVTRERGDVASALGYAHNQEQPLRRFLDDGRLRLDNNASERALRAIAVGRKNWLFMGSDDHATASANLFSLVASAKLHDLDPEAYLADVIRVLPYWPRDKYLELAPKYWRDTRARLDDAELARPIGHVTVPTADAAEEQPATR